MVLVMCGQGIRTYGQGPTLTWVKSIPYTYSNLVVDDSGHVYYAVMINAGLTLDFDPGPNTYNLTSVSRRDMVIVKLDTAGSFIWAKQFTGKAPTPNIMLNEIQAIAVDDSGNVYATGRFSDTVDFNPDTSAAAVHNLISKPGSGTAAEDIFVVKLNAAGEFVWAKAIGGAGGDAGQCIRLDPDGNVYVGGYFSGPAGNVVDFDPGPGVYNLYGSGTSGNGFLLKLSSTGDFAWAQSIPGVFGITTMAVSKDFKLYAAAQTSNNAFLIGTRTIVPQYLSNLTVIKLDSSGAYLWTKHIGSTVAASATLKKIEVDDFGNIYIAGVYTNDIDVDPDPANTYTLSVTGRYAFFTTWYNATAIFVTKWDSSGNFRWGSPVGGNRNIVLYSMSVEPEGKAVYMTGNFRDTVDFDPGPGTFNLVASGTATYEGTPSDIFVAKLEGTAGNFGWAIHYGANNNAEEEVGYAISEKWGDIYVTGRAKRGTDYNPSPTDIDTLPNADQVYIQKLSDECRYMTNPQAAISGPTLLCDVEDSASYTVAPFAGVVFYIWQLPAGWSGGSNTNTIGAAIAAGSGTISVQAVGNCGDTSLPVELPVVAASADVTITVNGNKLGTARNDYDSWQWYRNDTVINGATSATYTPAENGIYSVVVTKSGCSDTDFYSISNIAVHDPSGIPMITVYPNPAGDVLYIASPVTVNVTMTGIEGREVLRANHARAIDISSLAKGMYLLTVRDTEGRLIKVEQVVKR